MTYEECAKQNFTLAPKAPSLEWQITLFFYAAVHAANHVLFPGASAPPDFDHRQRGTAIYSDKNLRVKAREYRELMQLSLTARYQPRLHPMKQDQVDRAKCLAQVFMKVCNVSA
jgi:hypothetical protein